MSATDDKPRRNKPALWKRLTAYVFLVGLYFLFGVQGGGATGWASTLQLNISAGCITGFVVLLLQNEVLGA